MRLNRKTTVVGVLLTVIVAGSVIGAVAHAAAQKASVTSIASSHSFGGTPQLQRLSLQTSVPPAVSASVQQLATFDQTSATDALADVRLARPSTNLSSTVYVFNDDRGNACVVVVGETLFCNPDGGMPTAGINWSIGGGDSLNPDRLIAIYSSDVKSIALIADGKSIPVQMTDNIAYGEFPASTLETNLTVAYVDGSTRTIETNLTP